MKYITHTEDEHPDILPDLVWNETVLRTSDAWVLKK